MSKIETEDYLSLTGSKVLKTYVDPGVRLFPRSPLEPPIRLDCAPSVFPINPKMVGQLNLSETIFRGGYRLVPLV